MKGHHNPHTKESIEKMRQAALKKPTKFWQGKKRPDMTGENNPKWKGGYQNKLYLNRLRHARKMNAEGNHTLADWEILKAQYNWTCPCCGRREPDIQLSLDHIIPLIKGGSNNIENIQPLCRLCNSIKGTNIIKYNEKN